MVPHYVGYRGEGLGRTFVFVDSSSPAKSKHHAKEVLSEARTVAALDEVLVERGRVGD
jgi:hypothetical protein